MHFQGSVSGNANELGMGSDHLFIATRGYFRTTNGNTPEVKDNGC